MDVNHSSSAPSSRDHDRYDRGIAVRIAILHLGFDRHGVKIFSRDVGEALRHRGLHVLDVEIDGTNLHDLARVINRADILHIHFIPDFERWWGSRSTFEVFLREITVPVIVTFHDAIQAIKISKDIPFVHMIRGKASKVSCFTHKEAEVLLGVGFSDVVVIPHHLRRRELSHQDSLRSELGLENKTVVTVLGHVFGRKRYDLVIRALALLPQNFVLCIAGDTSDLRNKRYVNDLKKLVARLGLEQRVVFTGALSSEDYSRAIKMTDLAILPHSWIAGSGTFTDWVAEGKPILALTNDFVLDLDRTFPGALLLSTFDEGSLSQAIQGFFSGMVMPHETSYKQLAETLSPEQAIEAYLGLYRSVRRPATANLRQPLPSVWAITCFFNPAGYTNKVTNFLKFSSSLANQGVKLLAVELSFDGSFQIPDGAADSIVRFQGTSANIMWQKERLLSLALRALPDECTHVAWIDCDILFTDPTWVSRCVEALAFYDVIQPFQTAIRLDRDQITLSVQPETLPIGRGVGQREYSCCYRPLSGEIPHHAGFAWMSTKSFISNVGFYDRSIFGYGDYIMSSFFLGRNLRALRKHLSRPLVKDIIRWSRRSASRGSILAGCIPGSILHLWHGDRINRLHGYREAWIRKHSFDPARDITEDSNSLLRWNTDKTELIERIQGMFLARREEEKTTGTITDFDWGFYRYRYSDVRGKKSEADLMDHFMIHGLREGRFKNQRELTSAPLLKRLKDRARMLIIDYYQYAGQPRRYVREVYERRRRELSRR